MQLSNIRKNKHVVYSLCALFIATGEFQETIDRAKQNVPWLPLLINPK